MCGHTGTDMGTNRVTGVSIDMRVANGLHIGIGSGIAIGMDRA